MNRLMELYAHIWRDEENEKRRQLNIEHAQESQSLYARMEKKYAEPTEKQKECIRQGYNGGSQSTATFVLPSHKAHVSSLNATQGQLAGSVIQAQITGLSQAYQSSLGATQQNSVGANRLVSAIDAKGEELDYVLRAIEQVGHGEVTAPYDWDAYRALDRRRAKDRINLVFLASFCLCNGIDVSGAVMLMEHKSITVLV